MKVILLSLVILLVILSVIGLTEIQAQKDIVKIPSWVKASAGWWSENLLSDDEYIESLEFLINANIINLDNKIEIQNPIYSALPEESILVQNLNERVEELMIKMDEVEYSKDVLEEEFMQKESETDAYYQQELENIRSSLTEYYEDKINTIIDGYDVEIEERKDSSRLLNEKFDSLWNEYYRLYSTISEVRENTNPDDFE